MVGFSTHDLLEGAPGSHSVGQSPGIISSVGTPASSVEVEVFHFPTAVPHVGFSNDVIGVGINGSAEFVPIPLPMIMPISSRLQFIPDGKPMPSCSRNVVAKRRIKFEFYLLVFFQFIFNIDSPFTADFVLN